MPDVLAPNALFDPRQALAIQQPDPGNVSLADAWTANTQMLGAEIARQRAISEQQGLWGAGGITPAGVRQAVGNTALGLGTSDLPGGFRLYHGSGANFDRFSDQFIGSGEGNQAFGYGHYAAESEGVARSYRDQNRSWQGQIAPDFKQALEAEDFLGFDTAGQAVSAMRTHPDWRQRWDVGNPDGLGALFDQHEAARLAGQGHMYELNVNADPQHFLDWDKPLADQHPKVQEALKTLGVPDAEQASGQTAYRHLEWGGRQAGADEPAITAAQALHQAGIPGIRYLDQQSRSKGAGSSNYVVFDPATIDILRKYGIAGLGIGLGAATQGGPQPQQ